MYSKVKSIELKGSSWTVNTYKSYNLQMDVWFENMILHHTDSVFQEISSSDCQGNSLINVYFFQTHFIYDNATEFVSIWAPFQTFKIFQ